MKKVKEMVYMMHCGERAAETQKKAFVVVGRSKLDGCRCVGVAGSREGAGKLKGYWKDFIVEIEIIECPVAEVEDFDKKRKK